MSKRKTHIYIYILKKKNAHTQKFKTVSFNLNHIHFDLSHAYRLLIGVPV